MVVLRLRKRRYRHGQRTEDAAREEAYVQLVPVKKALRLAAACAWLGLLLTASVTGSAPTQSALAREAACSSNGAASSAKIRQFPPGLGLGLAEWTDREGCRVELRVWALNLAGRPMMIEAEWASPISTSLKVHRLAVDLELLPIMNSRDLRWLQATRFRTKAGEWAQWDETVLRLGSEPRVTHYEEVLPPLRRKAPIRYGWRLNAEVPEGTILLTTFDLRLDGASK